MLLLLEMLFLFYMLMYRFFEYCFYRIATVYIKRKIDKHPFVYACGWVTFGQLGNILTIFDIYQIFTNRILGNDKLLIWSIVLPLYIINTFFFMNEKKYKWMVEHYKEEKNRKIKGWAVFLYEIVSLLAFLTTRIILF
jgi:hypothetical protein